ncbi:MAG: TIR domain-containing protein [Acidobacteria bacterium]|nr:TIR domain-containing protein [Acidobacteriota bacterium]
MLNRVASPTPNTTYDVFLSYSRCDSEFVKLLEKALTEHSPADGQHLLSIFRDEGKITGNEYYRSIERALRQSRKLILVASPAAYKSQYVNDEVRDFIRMKGARNVFVILLKGVRKNEMQQGEESLLAISELLWDVLPMPMDVDYRDFGDFCGLDERLNTNKQEEKLKAALAQLIKGHHLNDWRRVLEHIYNKELVSADNESWDIFISYAAADAAFAAQLEKELEKYAPPKELAQAHNLPARRLKVFRDEDDATRDNSDAIRQALESSRQMFLLCSPAAREDRRVKQQVAQFAGLQGSECIVRVLVEGEPTSNGMNGAFPAELCHWIKEPAYTDYRGFTVRKDKLSEGIYGGHWTTMLAIHYQVTREELEQRERKRRRQNVQYKAFIALTVILGLSAALIWARFQRDEAVKQRRVAESGLYVSRELLAQTSIGQQHYQRANEFLEASFPAFGALDNDDQRSFDWFYLWRQTHMDKQTLKGQADGVNSVAVSPDGRTLASGGGDGTVTLWDVAQAKESATLRSGSDRVWSVSFAPDGRTLASGGSDGTVKIWEVTSGRELVMLEGHQDDVYSVAFAPDGRRLASGSGDGTVKLWDVAQAKVKVTLRSGSDHVWSVAFAPDGKTLASGGSGNVKLWDVASSRLLAIFKGHADGVYSVAFAPDGQRLASGGYDDTVKIWKVANGRATTLTGHIDDISSVAFTPDGRTLVSASDDCTIKLWDVASAQEKITFKGHGNSVNSIAMMPQLQMIASASSDGTVKFWDITGESGPLVIGKGDIAVRSVAIAPDGRTLAGSYGNGVKLWDITTKQEIATLSVEGDGGLSVVFAPDGGTLACDIGNKVRLWDVASKKEIATFHGHKDNIYTVAFAPDGKTIASGSGDGTVKLWEVAQAKEKATLATGSVEIWSVAFAPDGRTLAYGAGNEVKLWDMARQQGIPTLYEHRDRVKSLAFAPDGRTLASGSDDGTVKLWDVAQAKEKATLTSGSFVRSRGVYTGVYSLAFSPDGKTLASGRNGYQVKLWDVTSAQEKVTLNAEGGSVFSLAFAPDGRSLISGGIGWKKNDDQSRFSIYIWQGATDEEVARQCIRCGRKE